MTNISAPDFIPRPHKLTDPCSDVDCKNRDHRIPLGPQNLLYDDRYLYVRNSLLTPHGARHSRIVKWYQENPAQPAVFRSDALARIQDVHNAILRALVVHLNKEIDPSAVTIQLVQDKTAIQVEGEKEIQGTLELLKGDEKFISSQEKTVHAAMKFLRDHVLNPQHVAGHQIQPLPLSASRSVPVENPSNQKQKENEKGKTSTKLKDESTNSPSNGKTLSQPPTSFVPNFSLKKDANDKPKTEKAQKILSLSEMGKKPLAYVPKSNDLWGASSHPKLEKQPTVFIPKYGNDLTQPPIHEVDDNPPPTGFVPQFPDSAIKQQAADFLLNSPRDLSSQQMPVASIHRLHHQMDQAFDTALKGWNHGQFGQLSYDDFKNGKNPEVQAAFLKLVKNPDCKDADAVIVRNWLHGWFDVGYVQFQEKIDEEVFKRFIQERGILDDATSREFYLKYNAFREWFEVLPFEGNDPTLLGTAIICHFYAPGSLVETPS